MASQIGTQMDLNTITEVVRPKNRSELPTWRAGDAWLAGGTWLFSEPQVHLSRLIDLTDLNWPALAISETGLTISATCTVAQLNALVCPTDWRAPPLIEQCCRAFLASFKIWKTATIGGNLCMSLPAGPMISLLSALDGICTIWRADGTEATISVTDFVTGNHANVLGPGDLLRQIHISTAALHRRTAFRQISLTPVGRSAVLVIGTRDRDGSFLLTVTASTVKPVHIRLPAVPRQDELRDAIAQTITESLYHDDVHGKPVWRKAMTLRLAEQVRSQLADGA